MSPVKAVFIAPSLREASARLRVLQALPRIAGEGIEAQAREIPAKSGPRWAFFRGLRQADVVVLHRKLLNFLELEFLRRNARRLVFDFDDAIMYRDPFRGPPASRRRAGRFARTVRKADGIVAGNLYLKDRALESGAPGEVRIIPTPVDLSRHPAVPRGKREGVVLGWIGSSSTLPYLEDILPLLDELGRADPALTLRVVSDAFPATSGIRLDPRPWSEPEEGALLAGMDVGLMPLRDDPWSRGKCGYKILQYFASRLPVVASPVGVNNEIVRPGESGFLAGESPEWAEALSTLRSDPSLRTAMGESGRRFVEGGEYTLEEYLVRLGAFLRETA